MSLCMNEDHHPNMLLDPIKGPPTVDDGGNRDQVVQESKMEGSMQESKMDTLKCSATSHDSKAEYSREVAIPQNRRPTSNTTKMFQCLVAQPMQYVTTYVSAAFFLPLKATKRR